VHLNFEENQEFNDFVYFLLSILNGKAINKRDEQFFYFCKIEMLPPETYSFLGMGNGEWLIAITYYPKDC